MVGAKGESKRGRGKGASTLCRANAVSYLLPLFGAERGINPSERFAIREGGAACVRGCLGWVCI